MQRRAVREIAEALDCSGIVVVHDATMSSFAVLNVRTGGWRLSDEPGSRHFLSTL